MLVAAQDVPMGTQVGEPSVTWQVWPKSAISEQMIVRSGGSHVLDDITGSMTRVSFLRGEPMRRDKLVRAGTGGFMSAILPAGMRAVAIKIDNRGDSSAGSFSYFLTIVSTLSVYFAMTKRRGRAARKLSERKPF